MVLLHDYGDCSSPCYGFIVTLVILVTEPNKKNVYGIKNSLTATYISWFGSDDNIDGNNNSGYLQGVRLSSIELLDNFKTPITHLPTAEK